MESYAHLSPSQLELFCKSAYILALNHRPVPHCFAMFELPRDHKTNQAVLQADGISTKTGTTSQPLRIDEPQTVAILSVTAALSYDKDTHIFTNGGPPGIYGDPVLLESPEVSAFHLSECLLSNFSEVPDASGIWLEPRTEPHDKNKVMNLVKQLNGGVDDRALFGDVQRLWYSEVEGKGDPAADGDAVMDEGQGDGVVAPEDEEEGDAVMGEEEGTSVDGQEEEEKDDAGMGEVEDEEEGSSVDGHDGNWLVDEIIGKRYRGGVLEYHVKWGGSDEGSWIEEKRLSDCRRLVDEFESRNGTFVFMDSAMLGAGLRLMHGARFFQQKCMLERVTRLYHFLTGSHDKLHPTTEGAGAGGGASAGAGSATGDGQWACATCTMTNPDTTTTCTECGRERFRICYACVIAEQLTTDDNKLKPNWETIELSFASCGKNPHARCVMERNVAIEKKIGKQKYKSLKESCKQKWNDP
jgi:hypothetical protein